MPLGRVDWKALRGRFVPHNAIIDRVVRSAPADSLRALPGVEVTDLDLDRRAEQAWLRRHVPDWQQRFGRPEHKKLIELFASQVLLDPRPEHDFLDAAGGAFTYVDKLETRTRHLQDIRIPADLRRRLGPGVTCIECDAARIPLPDASLDRIACHHSFEHFQGSSDTGFVREVQRLLRPGGRCCIVPLFVGTRYVEVTDRITLGRKFDGRSLRVIDPTASIPGGKWCGSYARIYDTKALQDRVLAHVDPARFRVTLVRLTMDGVPVPDLTLPCHRHVTAVNRPYVALVIERRADR